MATQLDGFLQENVRFDPGCGYEQMTYGSVT
jgi:hypothetical protein